ncbi:MAG: hypothetical protein HF309_17975 [Ignavibacteria bacterium]|jgi:hypothetical protein|nr:hypothetical protein [Ignavibacteria bacterium]
MSRRKINPKDYIPKQNEYSLSAYRIIYLFSWHIGLIFLGLVVLPLFARRGQPSDERIFLVICIAMFLFSLPAILISLNYFRKSSVKKLIFDHKEKALVVFTHEGERRILFDAVRGIVQYASNLDGRLIPSKYPLGGTGLLLDNFNYSVLEIHNGEKIIITSLLIDKDELESHLWVRNIKLKGLAFPFIQ